MKPEEVRAWRERLGLSRAELADLFDMSVRSVEKWEGGERVPLRGSNVLERAFRDLERELADARRVA